MGTARSGGGILHRMPAAPSTAPAAAPPRGRGTAPRFVLYVFACELFLAVVPAANAVGAGGMAGPVLSSLALYGGLAALLAFGVSRIPALDAHPRAVAWGLALALFFFSVWAGRPALAAGTVSLVAVGLTLAGARMARRPSRLRLVLRSVLVLALALALGRVVLPPRGGAAPTAEPRPGAPSVLLVVVDTLRADALSSYGQAQPTSPHVDRLAREGVRFERAYGNAIWTLPGHASLFTGLWPSVHGAHNEHWSLDEGPPSLAERMGAGGWETVAFAGNALLSPGTGLTRGFGHVHASWRGAVIEECFVLRKAGVRLMGLDQDKGAAETVGAFGEWLARRDASRPYFAFVNLMEAHAPYHQVPRRFLERFVPRDVSERHLRDLSMGLLRHHMIGAPLPEDPRLRELSWAMYLAGVAAADEAVGRLADLLRERGELDRTVVIVTSDHGELFDERGLWGHQTGLLEGVLRIPFVVRWPGAVPGGRTLPGPIQQVDLVPTLLDLVGRPDLAPSDLPGRSFAEALRGGAAVEPGPAIAEHFTPFMLLSGAAEENLRGELPYARVRRRAVVRGDLKYTLDSRGLEALADLSADPREAEDLSPRRPDAVDAGRRDLADWVERGAGRDWEGMPVPAPEHVGPDLDPATREHLRALGYAN